MDILSNVSVRLKELMDEAGIKTPALASELAMEQSVITKFLRAERLPSATTLVKLSDYFCCTTDYLLGLSTVLDERKFNQRPPFHEQLDFLLRFFHTSKYRLEKETGLAEETVNNWHKGKYEPTVESLIRLAKHFQCSVDFILGRER